MPEMMTVTELKGRHGWTDAAVKRFLGDADETRPNPRYRSGSAMRLYSTIRIEAAEQADGWSEWVAKYESRSEKARRVVAEKTERLMEELTGEPVPTYWAGWTFRQVRYAAIESYNERARGDQWATADAGREFLDRITVNFLRHRGTDYESTLAAAAGRVGVRELYGHVRNRVLDAIAADFPRLARECEAQKSLSR